MMNRIRKARNIRGISQFDLAIKIGLKPAAISFFETGKRTPCVRNIRKLCEGLLISPNYLFGYTDFISDNEEAIERPNNSVLAQ